LLFSDNESNSGAATRRGIIDGHFANNHGLNDPVNEQSKMCGFGHCRRVQQRLIIQEAVEQRRHQEGTCTRFHKERTWKVARSLGFICAVQAIARSLETNTINAS
jgi:hypothetical protein